MIKTRIIWFILFFAVLMSILVYRLFDLQIINSDNYLNNFQMKIKKEKSIEAVRGNIYDCNGVLLAYNKLAYSIKIEDVYESGSKKNERLNKTIKNVIDIVENNGDKIYTDFDVFVDDYDTYQYSVSGTLLNRFKADIYGCAFIDDMTYAQSSSTAEELMDYLISDKRFNINTEIYDKDDALKIAAIRYAMSLNTYQKYIATTVAKNVSDETVAVIYENSDILDGVSVEEDTIRVYPTGYYTAQIIGYTGKISSSEYEELHGKDESYTINDIVGKTGIEKSQEAELRGKNGSETIYVDTMGRIQATENYVEAIAGNNIYLSIDSELQEAIYNILEQKLAGILLKKIINAKEKDPDAKDLYIPVYDVYYALINNNVIDITHFSDEEASDNEKEVFDIFSKRKESVTERLYNELTSTKTVYKKLTTEYKVYENYIEQLIKDEGILLTDKIDYNDKTYLDWYANETISLAEYINYCISKNWISNEYLKLDEAYSDSTEIYNAIVDIIMDELSNDSAFDRILYKYLIKGDMIKARTICNILLDQHAVYLTPDEEVEWNSGRETPFTFITNRIKNLDITPAQLALEPYSGSCVITDVNTGKVKACVSYPSYDNNFLANGADSEYLYKLNNDLSMPMLNYCTQQRTAPGSTYKMVSSIAGLCEGIVNTNTLITCLGEFKEISDIHNCWIYPGRHGPLNLSNAIRKSCNFYFYTVGYKLSLDENNNYNSNLGTEKLNKYATELGLGTKSGVEIEEYSPILTSAYSVPSAIGQGTNAFTTVGLAKYVTAIASSGNVYKLTMLDKLTDSNDKLIKTYNAELENHFELDDKYWDAIHSGMRMVVEDKSYLRDLKIKIAGKTGTAQQSRNNADHGLFVFYAPYEKPEIACAMRVANGYASDYVAEISKDIVNYYYGIKDEEDILTGYASEITVNSTSGD